jgi:hypothetical protein
MDPEDRAPQQHQPDRPERLEDARIDVLDRLVAEQQPLADEESVHDDVHTGMDREPPFAAAVLHRGRSDGRTHG